MNLTHKIVVPYGVLGALVIAVFLAIIGIEQRTATTAERETVFLQVVGGINEISARVQNGILTRQDAHAIAAAKVAQRIDGELSSLGADDTVARQLLQRFQDYYAGMVALNSMYLENRPADGEKRLTQVRGMESAIAAEVDQARAQAKAERQRLSTFARSFMIGAALALLLVVAVMVVVVRSQVVAPVLAIAKALEGIAQGQGDLTVQIPSTSRDEVGRIARAFNAMMNGLRDMVAATAASAREVHAAASEVAVSVGQVKIAADAQGESAASMAAAVEELTVSVNQVASMAADSERVANSAASHSEKGISLAAASATEMSKLTETGAEAMALTARLSDESQKIHNIVGVIHEIADQTNLLALNAAIEAARAGEQGRGFAVVADEVRKLAERTNNEVAGIRSIVDSMTSVVDGISKVISHSTEEEDHESATARAVQEIFSAVGRDAQEAATRVKDIAYATREQSQAANDIARNVETVAQMVEENSSAVDSVNDGANNLQRMADGLLQRLAGFRY